MSGAGSLYVGRPRLQIALIALFFAIVGPMVAGPFVIAIVWYFSLEDMTVWRAVSSGLVVTVLGFWAIIPTGAPAAAAVGTTVGWYDVKRRMTSLWIPVVSGFVFGGLWGAVLQYNISEFVAVMPAVATGSVIGSMACWGIVQWVHARRARGSS